MNDKNPSSLMKRFTQPKHQHPFDAEETTVYKSETEMLAEKKQQTIKKMQLFFWLFLIALATIGIAIVIATAYIKP
jgi:hypothetical protein